ncbi:hypothetical protein CPC08DRAFT_713452, partial [Agrocybe pediades]
MGVRPPSPITFAPEETQRPDSPIEFASVARVKRSERMKGKEKGKGKGKEKMQEGEEGNGGTGGEEGYEEDDEWDGDEDEDDDDEDEEDEDEGKPPPGPPGGRIGPSTPGPSSLKPPPPARPTTSASASGPILPFHRAPGDALGVPQPNAPRDINTSGYTLIRFSTGQILEEDLPISWYDILPHELVELHASLAPTCFAATVKLGELLMQPVWNPSNIREREVERGRAVRTRFGAQGAVAITWPSENDKDKEKGKERDGIPAFIADCL